MEGDVEDAGDAACYDDAFKGCEAFCADVELVAGRLGCFPIEEAGDAGFGFVKG